MTSERIQRQIDRLLDEAEAAVASRDWAKVSQAAADALVLDPNSKDAKDLLAAGARGLGGFAGSPAPTPPAPAELPTSFLNDRYQVKRFLGEGGKKRVYLAHDTTLDRDVAFSLIKTEGLDDTARQRVAREAQVMALGSMMPLPASVESKEH